MEYFDLSRPKFNARTELLFEANRDRKQTDPTIAGFNIGIDNGEAAGQTIGHCEKDWLENRIHEAVCSGRITVGDAQREIKEDGVSAGVGGVYGSGGEIITSATS